MKTTKMSLANIQGKLSREEMKNIMAGSASGSCRSGTCYVYNTYNSSTYSGYCVTVSHGSHGSHCMCMTSLGHYNSNNYAACS